MYRAITDLLCRLLKIPPEPTDPIGAPGSQKLFRAASNYFRYKMALWIVKTVFSSIGSVVALLLLGMAALDDMSKGNVLDTVLMCAIMCVIIGSVLLEAAISFFAVRLDYEMRWYKVSDRSLRIREGVIKVREITMTFANIQNMSITQGPLQRLLGIADLKVVSTGGGGGLQPAAGGKGQGIESSSAPHSAFFRGIDNASEILALIRERMKKVADTGLGHPDEPEHHGESELAQSSSDGASGRIQLLQRMLQEATALRSVIP